MKIEEKLREMGMVLPEAFRSPSGAPYPFEWVRIRGSRATLSGHLPLAPDGTLAEPRGKVGGAVTVEEGQAAARLVALAMLGSLTRAGIDLERVTWVRVFGMVNAAPGWNGMAQVMNAFSNLLIELFGPERGAHSRSAMGAAELPFDVAVEIEAEVEIG
ncbi:MAG TPA: RidA family protein [Longimicrobium sp.]|nr:RidA family protein [Longimicrobium sp.]